MPICAGAWVVPAAPAGGSQLIWELQAERGVTARLLEFSAVSMSGTGSFEIYRSNALGIPAPGKKLPLAWEDETPTAWPNLSPVWVVRAYEAVASVNVGYACPPIVNTALAVRRASVNGAGLGVVWAFPRGLAFVGGTSSLVLRWGNAGGVADISAAVSL